MTYGTVNADVIGTSVAGSNLGAGNASIMKNRIINGAMVISQRNGTSSATLDGASAYTLDRWQGYDNTDGSFTVAQTTTAPTGFNNSLKVTVATTDTSLGATQFAFMRQYIEGYNVADLGWGTANAKTVTVSFWVYSSLTGTFGGSIINDAGDRGYPFSYTISAANTWEQKSVTIAGDTTGTWGTTNGTGLALIFGLGVGSSYSGTAGSWQAGFYCSSTGATNVMATSGATFYITGVQLEVGSSATGFEYENISQTYSKCQRYYQVLLSGNDKSLCLATWYNSSEWDGVVFFPTMRSAPTASSTTVSAGYYFDKLGGNITFDNITGVFGAGLNVAQPFKTGLSGGVAGYCGSIRTLNASCFIALSAEL
jgi:hypothetical protein